MYYIESLQEATSLSFAWPTLTVLEDPSMTAYLHVGSLRLRVLKLNS